MLLVLIRGGFSLAEKIGLFDLAVLLSVLLYRDIFCNSLADPLLDQGCLRNPDRFHGHEFLLLVLHELHSLRRYHRGVIDVELEVTRELERGVGVAVESLSD